MVKNENILNHYFKYDQTLSNDNHLINVEHHESLSNIHPGVFPL